MQEALVTKGGTPHIDPIDENWKYMDGVSVISEERPCARMRIDAQYVEMKKNRHKCSNQGW